MSGFDVCALIRRDHDDLDRGLAALVEPTTPPKELTNILEIFRLALAVHSAAESTMLDLLLSRVHAPRTLGLLATQTRIEHIAQREAAEVLTRIRPGSLHWYEHAAHLRHTITDHASRADHTRWTLLDHVPIEVRRAITREYATERMRVLASTAPLLLAQQRDAIATSPGWREL